MSNLGLIKAIADTSDEGVSKSTKRDMMKQDHYDSLATIAAEILLIPVSSNSRPLLQKAHDDLMKLIPRLKQDEARRLQKLVFRNHEKKS